MNLYSIMAFFVLSEFLWSPQISEESKRRDVVFVCEMVFEMYTEAAVLCVSSFQSSWTSL